MTFQISAKNKYGQSVDKETAEDCSQNRDESEISEQNHVTIFDSNDASLNDSILKYEGNGIEKEENSETEQSNCPESSNNNNILKDSDEEKYHLNDTGNHVCQKCGTVIKSRKHFIRHWNKHIGVKFRCNYCGTDFSRRDKLQKHIREQHEGGGEKPEASPTQTALLMKKIRNRKIDAKLPL